MTISDQLLGARLAAILNANISQNRNEQGVIVQQDPVDEQLRHVVIVTDKFFDLTKAARQFREMLEAELKVPRRKKKAGAR